MAVLSLSFRNHFDELPALQAAVSGFLEKNGGEEADFAANLAIEELVTNIIKYGYDDQGEHLIELSLALEDDVLTVEIRDDGHAFDPFDRAEPDITLPAAERDIGGLGIHFVRKMLDSCAYDRREGINVVTVTKKL